MHTPSFDVKILVEKVRVGIYGRFCLSRISLDGNGVRLIEEAFKNTGAFVCLTPVVSGAMILHHFVSRQRGRYESRSRGHRGCGCVY